MGEIFVPAQLSNLESIVKELAPVLNESARKKIGDDIVAFHALNESESKKAAEARALIKQHSDILEAAKKQAMQNKLDAETLEKKRLKTESDLKEKRKKLEEDSAALSTASQDALTLHNNAVEKLNEVSKRDRGLAAQKESHAIDVKTLADDRASLSKEYEKVEAIKKQHSELLESLKAKHEAVAAIINGNK